MEIIQGYACLTSWPEDSPVFYGPPQDTKLEVENVNTSGFKLFATLEEASDARDVIIKIKKASSVNIYWLDMEIAEGRENWPQLPKRDTFVVLAEPDYGLILLGPHAEECISFGYIGGDFATNGLKGFSDLRDAGYCAEQSVRQAESPARVVSLSIELVEVRAVR